ncbi:hypothetical protein HII31_08193 [Pseudocercospora fuligena]|uniref:Uncharacterized protein n=1 Tax=Pseudocercospora fuligena TaxID=685502 RepID=A0A8H6RFA7_9PEZI|nr:hypothetical protein HII31_08193 [Pseudocercospora fuligena]
MPRTKTFTVEWHRPKDRVDGPSKRKCFSSTNPINRLKNDEITLLEEEAKEPPEEHSCEAENKKPDTLLESVQNLTLELFDEIKSHLFATPDCHHGSAVRIHKGYKPPFQLSLNKTSRAAFATDYFSQTRFKLRPCDFVSFCTWLKSLQPEHRKLVTYVEVEPVPGARTSQAAASDRLYLFMQTLLDEKIPGVIKGQLRSKFVEDYGTVGYTYYTYCVDDESIYGGAYARLTYHADLTWP